MNPSNTVSTHDFRAFLELELARRNSVNPNYSLRAFARDLGVDSSFLSKLLNGKRSMTGRTILTLAPRLPLSEEQVQSFVKNSNGRRRRYGAMASRQLLEIEDQAVGETIEWYHLAILALFDVKNFQPEPGWIGERLNLSLEQVQQALEELTTVKLLARDEKGGWLCQALRHTVSSQRFPRVNLIKQQILEQAAELAPKKLGDHSAMTLAISESRLGEAVERIQKFRRELAHFLNEPKEKDGVYHLAISLFPAISKASK
jgi:uncharacterized protein (TIGR02147 family)